MSKSLLTSFILQLYYNECNNKSSFIPNFRQIKHARTIFLCKHCNPK